MSTRAIRVLVPVALLFGLCAALAACSGSQLGEDSTTGTQPMTVTVNILGNRFDPQAITIPVGSTVMWHNTTSADHGVTCGLFDADLRPGRDYSYTFNQAGTYRVESSTHDPQAGLYVDITVE